MFQELGGPLPLSTVKLAIVLPSFIPVQLHWIQQDRASNQLGCHPLYPINSLKESLPLMLVDTGWRATFQPC